MEIIRTVHASVLIAEVKKHPILYDMRSSSGHNTEKKRQTWETIASKICGQSWDGYDELERENIAKEFQVKWKHLRDNFTRIMKREKMEASTLGNSTKKKKYIYYDQMSFIKPYITNKQMNIFSNDDGANNIKEEMDCSSDGTSSNIIYINESDDSKTKEDAAATVPPPYQRSIRALGGSIGTLTPIQLVQINPNTPNADQSSAHAPRAAAEDSCAKALEALVQIQQEENNDDAMGNKKFLLSLLPFLRKMTDDVNLEVRLQLLSVVHNYSEKS